MGPGRLGEAVAAETGSFHRFLNIHTEIYDVAESLEVALGLAVTARSAQGHEGFAVLEDDKCAWRGAGPLAGRQSVGIVFIQPEVAARQLARMPVSPSTMPWASAPKLLGVADTRLPSESTVAR